MWLHLRSIASVLFQKGDDEHSFALKKTKTKPQLTDAIQYFTLNNRAILVKQTISYITFYTIQFNKMHFNFHKCQSLLYIQRLKRNVRKVEKDVSEAY